MSGAGNPLNYDYRDPRHVERYNKLVIRHPTGETEGKHPRDADVDVMRAIHEPGPLLWVIRTKCIECSGRFIPARAGNTPTRSPQEGF